MRKLLVSVFVFVSLAGIAQTPVKISALPPISGNGSGGYLPIAKAGVTYKIAVDSLGLRIYVDSPIIATALGDTAILLKLDTNQAHNNGAVNQYQLSQVGGGGGGGLLTASNGLTAVGTDVQLGGDLSADVDINGGGAYGLSIFQTTGFNFSTYNEDEGGSFATGLLSAFPTQASLKTTSKNAAYTELSRAHIASNSDGATSDINLEIDTLTNQNTFLRLGRNYMRFYSNGLLTYYPTTYSSGSTVRTLPISVQVNGVETFAGTDGKVDLGTISGGGGSTDTTGLSARIDANTTAIAGKQAAYTEVSGEEATGATTSTITLAHAPLTGTFKFYKNGVRLPAAEFSRSGVTVTLNSARLSGDLFQSDYNY